jgi:hypothetical protein
LLSSILGNGQPSVVQELCRYDLGKRIAFERMSCMNKSSANLCLVLQVHLVALLQWPVSYVNDSVLVHIYAIGESGAL